jgi:hypothetical protein
MYTGQAIITNRLEIDPAQDTHQPVVADLLSPQRFVP